MNAFNSEIPTLKEFFIARDKNRLMEYVLAHKQYARQEEPGAIGPDGEFNGRGGCKQYLLMREGIRRIDELLAAEYAARRVLSPAVVSVTSTLGGLNVTKQN